MHVSNRQAKRSAVRRTKPGEQWKVRAKSFDSPTLQLEVTQDGSVRSVSGHILSRVAAPFLFDSFEVGEWLHLEQMNDSTWWMRVGGQTFMVSIDQHGNATLVHQGTGEVVHP